MSILKPELLEGVSKAKSLTRDKIAGGLIHYVPREQAQSLVRATPD